MAQVLIVYATDHGGTKKMAEAVAAGVTSVTGCQAVLKEALEVTYDDLVASDGLIVGTPVHMGGMDWRVKKFIDTVCSAVWMKDAMVGRAGGVFACGSGYGNAGAGCELTMLSVLNNLAELGLVLAPLPKSSAGYQTNGLQWGAYARAHNEDLSPKGVSDAQLVAATAHGANIARLAIVLKENEVFA